MQRHMIALALLLLVQFPALADLKIVGPSKIPQHKFVELSATGVDPEAAVLWDVLPEEPADIREIDGRLYFVAPPGTYKIKLRSIKGKKVETARHVVEIEGAVGPGPAPGPGPGPTPTPGPTPPAPIPEPGFRVLFVFEQTELAKLPSSQVAALSAQEIRDYLASHCAMSADGKTVEARFFDQNTVVLEPLWKAAMSRPRASLPWMVISNGKTGFEGPMPTTTKEVLALLKKYGGE